MSNRIRAGDRESAVSLVIRPYEDSDETTVCELWRTVFEYPGQHNRPEESIRRKLAVDRDLFLVAQLNRTVVGTVMGGYDGHRGWIYSLAVAEAVRGRGIGTALVRELELRLANRGCPKINLQVRADNSATVAFYEGLGYSVEDRISLGKVL